MGVVKVTKFKMIRVLVSGCCQGYEKQNDTRVGKYRSCSVHKVTRNSMICVSVSRCCQGYEKQNDTCVGKWVLSRLRETK